MHLKKNLKYDSTSFANLESQAAVKLFLLFKYAQKGESMVQSVKCYSRNDELVFSIDQENNVQLYDRKLINQLTASGIRACVIGLSPDPIGLIRKAQEEQGKDIDYPVRYYSRQFIKPPTQDASSEEKEYFAKALLIWANLYSKKEGYTIKTTAN